MTVSMQELYQEERLFDEHSLGSMQPSDEIEGDYDTQFEDVPDDERSFDRSSRPNRHSTPLDEPLESLKESFFANQLAIADYFAELVPTFSVEGSKVTDLGRSMSNASFSQYDASRQETATFSKLDESKSETKAKRTGSTHSRCIIENPESIQERQDEELRRRAKEGDEDDARDQASTMSSVEFSQISELTMDMPTVATEQPRFAQCSALPTISEVKELDTPQLAASCTSGVVKGKAKCAAAADTTMNQIEENNDFLDFVFELVEDAVCKPLKTSKSERKKVFMEAFHEESEKILKLANKNGAKDPFRETSKHSRRGSSRHSRTSTGTKRSTKPKNSEYPMDEEEEEESMLNPVENSLRSLRKSDHSRIKIVDKPPLQPPGFNSAYPLNEELTIDWSKVMSLAEKQLEAEDKSVVSNDSRVSEVSGITENPSMFQSVKCEEDDNHDASVLSDESPKRVKPGAHSMFKSSVSSTVSTSVSTHSALAKHDFVEDLRELSALDSSSFEEEQSRFILTTSLFRYMKSFVPSLSDLRKKKSKKMEFEDRAFDEVSVASIPSIKSMDGGEFEFENADDRDEETMLRVMHYIAFFYAFVFWPAGISKKNMSKQYKQKSLLQLVNERR
eukprot:CAMPEP_0116157230 /NCGR_PEP_ID=MMETSP0329-20121206/23236_1 /TAXON_ID=697910 /ORGANISM="Pseudo-nitzschia arenysensis, Strain B593" /LENGTH=619 /DNA_ID=CAMNT_0003654329 /DNA_START=40 /DNA_END=1899 /DNA_ORIENTATION=-